jgi:hypothetical protein
MSDHVSDDPVETPQSGAVVDGAKTAQPDEGPAVLTAEMLPTIRACVLDKRIWLAAWSLAGWGALTLLCWAGNLYADGESSPGRLAQWSEANAAGVCGVLMIAIAAFALIKRSPRVLLTEALLVGAEGLYLILFGVRAGGGIVVVGFFQLLWAYRECRRRMAVYKWESDLKATSPQDLARMREVLKSFCRSDEDFARGRVRAVVTDRDFLSNGYAKGYRGQLLADRAILISRSRDDCLVVQRDHAGGLPYKRNMTKVDTEQGLKQFALGPASVLAWKLWAGVSVAPLDIRYLAGQKKATLAILRTFLQDGQGDVKLACVEAMRKMRRDPDVPEATRQLLADSDPSVRAAAAGLLADARSDGMSPHVLPLLSDNAVVVRIAAADYFRARPDASAATALRQALHVEADSKAQKRLRKALDACEVEPSNPYASQRGL